MELAQNGGLLQEAEPTTKRQGWRLYIVLIVTPCCSMQKQFVTGCILKHINGLIFFSCIGTTYLQSCSEDACIVVAAATEAVF